MQCSDYAGRKALQDRRKMKDTNFINEASHFKIKPFHVPCIDGSLQVAFNLRRFE